LIDAAEEYGLFFVLGMAPSLRVFGGSKSTGREDDETGALTIDDCNSFRMFPPPPLSLWRLESGVWMVDVRAPLATSPALVVLGHESTGTARRGRG
jgi:hypothetical protein